MNTARLVIAIAGLALATACSDTDTAGPGGPGLSAELERGERDRDQVAVMTRNLYIGVDVDAVIGALFTPDPGDDLPALEVAIATLQATDFPTRARAIAGEIARTRPHVIGLQEVYLLHVDLTGVGLPVTIDMDYLQVLQAALAERRLPYVVAAKVRDTDASPFPGISLVDFDVVLVDARRVEVEPGAVAQTYAANIGPVAPGVDIRRGYIVLRARVDGRAVTIANTHLESGSSPALAQLRAAQAGELAAAIGTASPVILTGDLNDVPDSPMYQVLTGVGLADTWRRLGGRASGLSCCQLPDLSNRRSEFTQRIDYVFARGFEQPRGGLEGRDFLVGWLPDERVRGPAGLIWPSDHAGLVAEIAVPRIDRERP